MEGTVRETFQSVHQILAKILGHASRKQTGFRAIVLMVTGTVHSFHLEGVGLLRK